MNYDSQCAPANPASALRLQSTLFVGRVAELGSLAPTREIHMPTKEKASSLLGSIVLVLLAVMIIAKTSRDIRFYFDKNVIAVNTPADIEKLHDNTIAEVSLGLDLKQAYAVSYLSQREFLLIPFSGVGYRLMYVIEGPLSDKLIAGLHPPYKGRVVEKDFADSWEVYDKPMKLKKIFARDRIELPANAMLVYDAPKELPNLWMFFICALSISYLVYKAYSLARLLRADKNTPSATP
jgi:hypothetical protein